MKNPELIIVGAMALDTVETPFGKVEEAVGGSAVYAGLAASYFAKPGLVSIIGDDFPQSHLTMLEGLGCGVEGIEKKGKTFRWSGSYEFDMNQARTHKTELNSLLDFDPQLPETYRPAPFIFLANIDPAQQLDVLDQVAPGSFVIVDSMNYWIESKREILEQVIKKATVVLMNEGEARQFCGTPNLIKAGRAILELGPQYVIIKKGEHGALMFGLDSFFSAPGYPLEEVRDPTGAGDSFAGGVIGYLASKNSRDYADIRKGVIYGSAIASCVAEHFSIGYREKTTIKEIEERYEVFKKMREF